MTTLVACVGNVFLGDDGFGVEVYRELAARPMPDGVRLLDVGIRGVHLAYELLDGCELLILVDAAPRGETPGTVSIVEIGPVTGEAPPVIDAHGLGPDDVFALMSRLDSRPARTLLVACEPLALDTGMQLSEPVRAAVPVAARTVVDLLRDGGGS